jgi:hypothetical protein
MLSFLGRELAEESAPARISVSTDRTQRMAFVDGLRLRQQRLSRRLHVQLGHERVYWNGLVSSAAP